MQGMDLMFGSLFELGVMALQHTLWVVVLREGGQRYMDLIHRLRALPTYCTSSIVVRLDNPQMSNGLVEGK
jgi:hypothetical protein